jgi:site-specific DNA-cytosine methylase
VSGLGLRIGSLFSGIGGLDLGLERAGVGHPAWFCDIEPHALKVLARRWLGVPLLTDVREVTPATAGPIDVLCGGFPCQDISLAGAGAGLAGARSGLFYEMMRVARAFAPRFVVFENVAAIRARGLDAVLAELHAAGYDAAWSTFGADAVGAPHRRLRWWCVAWRRGEGAAPAMGSTWAQVGTAGKPPQHGVMSNGRIAHGEAWADVGGGPVTWPTPTKREGSRRVTPGELRRNEPGLHVRVLSQWPTPVKWEGRQAAVSPGDLRRNRPGLRADAVCADVGACGDIDAVVQAVRDSGLTMSAEWCETLMGFAPGWTADDTATGAWLGWPARPGEGRNEGEPRRTVPRGTQADRGKRVAALGNAVVPQCAEIVGLRLLQIAGAL